MSQASQYVSGPARVPLGDGERIDWHHHDVHQLIHPRNGVLTISTPAGDWVVPPHRAVWIPAGVDHAHRAHGETDLHALTFDGQLNPLGVHSPTVLAVSALLREVIAALTGTGLPALHRRNLERVVLDQLHRVPALPLCLPQPSDARLRDIADLLHRDPGDERTLAQLGAAIGAGERTLARLFRAETGMSFAQWRTQLRLHHSLALLAAGTDVTTTATACGYNGPSAFIHAFRRAFGLTPGQYRRPELDLRESAPR